MLPEAILCLATAIYHESRGEPLPGQFAVAEVIIRRQRSGRWPDTVCGVVYQRMQFAWTRREVRVDTGSGAWRQSLAVAKAAWVSRWNGWGAATFCADHFHSGRPPGWAEGMTVDRVIGGHVFYCADSSHSRPARF